MAFSSTLIALVKRVPIEKKGVKDAPTADQVRSIDVFSLLVRAVASVITQGLKSWISNVLLPRQHATTGGALVAASRLNLQAELILAGASRSSLSRLCSAFQHYRPHPCCICSKEHGS